MHKYCFNDWWFRNKLYFKCNNKYSKAKNQCNESKTFNKPTLIIHFSLFITSSKNGLLPFLMHVLFVWPPTVTLTTGLMLMPGSCLPSMTRTRTWTINHSCHYLKSLIDATSSSNIIKMKWLYLLTYSTKMHWTVLVKCIVTQCLKTLYWLEGFWARSLTTNNLVV